MCTKVIKYLPKINKTACFRKRIALKVCGSVPLNVTLLLPAAYQKSNCVLVLFCEMHRLCSGQFDCLNGVKQQCNVNCELYLEIKFQLQASSRSSGKMYRYRFKECYYLVVLNSELTT